MKKKNGFTLVELLAVIVILAIILVIAVPQILSTINSARDESMKSSAKMVIDSAEREYTTRLALGTLDQTNDAITCADVATLTTADYGACTLTFDGSGNVTLDLAGAANGKFNGKYICDATKSSTITIATSACS